MAPICGKITLPKEFIRTKKVTNIPKLINQSEEKSTEVIVVYKFRTYLSVNYWLTGETRENVTPEKTILRNKRNIKSLDSSPPRKFPIPNQD